MGLANDFEAIGRILVQVRDRSGLTQAALSKTMGINATRIFRIENGEVIPTDEEIEAYLIAVDKDLARDCHDYLHSKWADATRKPSFPHPNWRTLHTIDAQLARVAALKADKDTKAVFVRALDLYASELIQCAEFLEPLNHLLVFVGIISVGKTSAICTSLGLALVGETMAFARRMVLEVGGGRTTLCEVRVDTGPQYGLIIEPCTDEEVRRFVLDYADHLLAVNKHPEKPKLREKTRSPEQAKHSEISKPASPEDVPWISEETARAIRGLAGLTEGEIAALANSFPLREELSIQILKRIDLLRRRETTVWRTDDNPGVRELEWLQRVFKEINNGRRPGFSLPKRVTVVVPRKLFDIEDINIAVIDTKGIDQTSARADIDSHFDDPHAIMLLCTKFGEAPDLATINLIRRASALHLDNNLENRLALLVLPRDGEALDMKDETNNDFVNSAEAGYAAKLLHIRRALQPFGLENLPVRFLNATSSEDIAAFREFVVNQFVLVRRQYEHRVRGVVQKLDELVEHRRAVERARALTEVMEHLRVWTRDNRSLDGILRPDELLVDAIQSAHPRTLWASVRRDGVWYNFDYYYQLGFATRQIFASTAGEKLKNLKAVIDNLSANEDYADAGEFLRQISDHVDGAVDRLSRQVQVAGQTLYRDPLRSASSYWKECEAAYGTRRPYRAVVAEETRDWFSEATITELHQRLSDEINRSWDELIQELDQILTLPSVPTVG